MNKSIILALTYIFGLISYFSHLEIPLAITLFVLLTAGILSKHLSRVFAIILTILFIFANFNAKHATKTGDELSKLGFKNNVVLEGRIATIPELSMNASRLRFYFEVEGARGSGSGNSKTFVTINAKEFNRDALRVGNIIEIKGKLRKPFAATNPSQFDYAQYLARKNVFSTFYSEGENYSLLSNPTPRDFWWWGFQKLDLIRENIIQKHAKYLKSPNLEVLGGIVFGDDAVNPPDEIKQIFINSGLLHLLAASGLNVALIFGIWWFIAKRARLPYRTNIALGMLLVVFYSLMTGLGPSITRATIMILFVLLGKLINKDSDGLSLVFFVGLIMLVISPQMLFDVGFQLSFMVTIALIFATPIVVNAVKEYDLEFKKQHKDKAKPVKGFLNQFSPASLMGVISVPIVAQLAVAPIQAHYFNTFTPYSVFANLCITPFIGLISFLGFMGSILGAIGLEFILKISDIILNPFITLLLGISEFFSGLKGSLITTSSPDLAQIALYYSLVFAFFINLRHGFKSKRIIASFIVLTMLFSATFIKIPSKNFEILAFDVGNADCFLITTPERKRILIDTAKQPYRGRSQASHIMNEYFKDNSIRTLDLMIITHFDNDHSGGAIDIMKNFKVKKVLVNSKDDKIVRYMDKHKINYEIAKNGTVVYFEPDLKIKTYMHPGQGNEGSIITLAGYQGSNLLFMGDADSSVYEKLKSQLPSSIDILKVGHHGAKNSLSKPMVENLNPKIALISTGYNTYGHPALETLELISTANAAMISTQEFGALKFTYNTEDKTYKVEHFDKKFAPVE